MWYIYFLFPDSAPYKYLTIKNGKVALTSSQRGAILFQNRLQAKAAAESFINNSKTAIYSYRLANTKKEIQL